MNLKCILAHSFLCISGNGNQDVDSSPAIYHELPIHKFFTFNIPFSLKGSTDVSTHCEGKIIMCINDKVVRVGVA